MKLIILANSGAMTIVSVAAFLALVLASGYFYWLVQQAKEMAKFRVSKKFKEFLGKEITNLSAKVSMHAKTKHLLEYYLTQKKASGDLNITESGVRHVLLDSNMNYHSYTHILERIFKDFDSYTVLELNEKNDRVINIVIEVLKGGVPAYIAMTDIQFYNHTNFHEGWVKANIANSAILYEGDRKRTRKYFVKKEDFDKEKYRGFLVVGSMYVCVPPQNGALKLETLKSIWDSCTVKSREAKLSKQIHSAKMYHMTTDANGNFDIGRPTYSEEYHKFYAINPNNTFMPFDWTFNHKEMKGIEPTRALEAMHHVLNSPNMSGNVILLGKPDLGKSSIMKYLKVKLSKDPLNVVMNLDPTHFKALAEGKLSNFFANLSTSTTVDISQRKRNYIFIDEADLILANTNDAHNPLIKEMMAMLSGEKISANLRFCIAANVERKDLFSGFVKAGRTCIIHEGTYLDKETASRKIGDIQLVNEEENNGLSFDKECFENLFIAETDMSPKGYCTLGELHNKCFYEKVLLDYITNMTNELLAIVESKEEIKANEIIAEDKGEIPEDTVQEDTEWEKVPETHVDDMDDIQKDLEERKAAKSSPPPKKTRKKKKSFNMIS